MIPTSMVPYRIHKHKLFDTTTINLPLGTQVMHVGLDPNGTKCLWALEPQHGKDIEERTFEIRATGEEVTNMHHYHGTILDDPFVWHIFEYNPTGRMIW